MSRGGGRGTDFNMEPILSPNSLADYSGQQPQFFCEISVGKEKLRLSNPKAQRAMVALMDMEATLGGAASHWGGPASLAELMSALYGYCFFQSQKRKQPWFEVAHLINDEGHSENGIYALRANYGLAKLNLESLKAFRSMDSVLTGHGEAHLFPEGVYLSNGPLGSSLPQAQGLAMADCLSGSSRATIAVISDGAAMEGEAKESFAAIPGFATKKQINPFILIVNDNETKLSGRISEQSFSMKPTFKSFSDLGWEVVCLEKGNDLLSCWQAIESAFEKATQGDKPVVIHAKTIKGFGVKKTMDSASGGHGFPLKKPEELYDFLKEIYEGEEVPSEFTEWADEIVQKHKNSQSAGSSVPIEKVQVGLSKALVECKNEGLPLVSVSSDLSGSTGLGPFIKAFPEASFDVGIAESNMVSVAAGFSKQGFIPLVDTFAQFGVTKGALPLIMASLSQAPVIAVFSHIGFQDAADGASHQALSYLAMTCSLPNTQVYLLSTSEEAYCLVKEAVKEFAQHKKEGRTPPSYIFFLGRESFVPSLNDQLKYPLNKAEVVFDSSDQHKESVAVVSAGPLLHQCLLAAEQVKDRGVIVVNSPRVDAPDVQTISKVLEKTQGRLLTVEDHQVVGGFGSLLVHELTQQGVSLRVKSLGVKGEFGRSAYQALQLYRKHGLDFESIAKSIKNF